MIIKYKMIQYNIVYSYIYSKKILQYNNSKIKHNNILKI